MKKLKAHFQNLKKNMQGMTWKEKVDHIWIYYKEAMLIAFIATVIVVGVLLSIFSERPVHYCSGVMSNVDLTQQGHTYLTDTFLEQVLQKDGNIFLRTSELVANSEISVQATHSEWENTQSLYAQIESKDIDYLLLDNYSVQYYADKDIYLDLDKVGITQEELEELAQKNMLFSIYVPSEDKSYPVAINISETQFGKDCVNTAAPVYLAFITNTEERENCLKLWEHIKAWKSE